MKPKLSSSTEIEVIAIKDGKYYKKLMTLGEAEVMERKKGFQYLIYQRGYSQFKTE